MRCNREEANTPEQGKFCALCRRYVETTSQLPEPSRQAYGVVAGRSLQFSSPFPAAPATDVNITIALRMSVDDIVATLWSVCHDTAVISTDDVAALDVEVLTAMLDSGSVQVEDAIADISETQERSRRLTELVYHVDTAYTQELGREILALSGETDSIPLSAEEIVAIIWRKRQHDTCQIPTEYAEIREQAVEFMENPVRNTVAFGKYSIEMLHEKHQRLEPLAQGVNAVYRD